MIDIAAAIEAFRAAALEKGDYAQPVSKDHRLHRRMGQALRFLQAAGDEGRVAIRCLLKDPSPHVHKWIAAELLAQGDGTVIPLLEKVASEGGLMGLEAEMVLREYRAGRLRSPFDV
jgi:hypothetical protein